MATGAALNCMLFSMVTNSSPPPYETAKYSGKKTYPTKQDKSKTIYQSSNLSVPNAPILAQVSSQQNIEENLRQIIERYEISKKFANKLQILHGFKIVYVFDDSGSMNSTLEDSPLNSIGSLMKAKRWDELQHYSKISLEISTLFNPEGCDVYFLNRGIARNVKSSSDLQPYFQESPKGFTPLRETFDLVVKENGFEERKLLVVIITDGEPTDKYGVSEVKEFRKCLKERQYNKNFVTIVACTDDDNSVDYLNKWDNEIKHLDVVDDFRNERDQIRKAQGKQFPFSYGDYAVKSLIGSIDQEIDNLDEINCCCNII